MINHSTESIPPLSAGHENSRSQPLTRHCATAARAWGWAGYRLTRAAPWRCVAKVPSDPCKTTLFCADSHQESNQRHHARFVRKATRGRFSGEQWIVPKRLNQIKVLIMNTSVCIKTQHKGFGLWLRWSRGRHNQRTKWVQMFSCVYLSALNPKKHNPTTTTPSTCAPFELESIAWLILRFWSSASKPTKPVQ